MRYGNCRVKRYPHFTSLSCFNFNVVDETKLCARREKKKDSTDEEKRRISRLRARNKIFDIALLNEWQYFVTFTFNDRLVNAYDYKESMEKVKKWCQNQVQRNGLRYLLVPELHPSSGRVHLHGLLDFSNSITLSETNHFDKSGRRIYNLPSWRYGFSTIIRLDNNSSDKIAKYITKYVTKELDKITGNYYYAGGKNLNRDCDTYYINTDYRLFNGFEVKINEKMAVKYSLIDNDSEILLGYESYD